MMINQAFKIATRDLRKCYSSYGILAGTDHFDDYWARDSFFASLGALRLKDYKIVRKNLSLFLKYEKDQLPLRIDNYLIYNLKFINIRLKGSYKARYTEDKLGNTTVDQNSLFIIALSDYLNKSKDLNFFKKNFKAIKKIIDWNFTQDAKKGYLIEEKSYSNWADSIKKQGKVLYTNVLHCKAVYEFYKLSKDKNYLKLYQKIKSAINKEFWNGKFYVDFIGNNYLSTDGNILGILFDIFPKDRVKKVIDFIERKRKNDFISLSYPQYDKSLIYWPFYFIDMYDYHNMVWLWLDSLYVLALYKLGYKKESKELLEKISDLIVKYDGVHEIYERKNKKYIPVKRFFYKAETPFAWSSGLFIYAVKEMKII